MKPAQVVVWREILEGIIEAVQKYPTGFILKDAEQFMMYERNVAYVGNKGAWTREVTESNKRIQSPIKFISFGAIRTIEFVQGSNEAVELIESPARRVSPSENCASFPNIWKWLKNNHDSFHVVLLISQLFVTILATGIIGYFTYRIQEQNYNIQRALYDFEPQVRGYASNIWVYGYNYQTTARIEILINSPHSGNFFLRVNQFYPESPYLDPTRLFDDRLDLNETIRGGTSPQSYTFKGDVSLVGHLYPIQNLNNTVFFYAGRLEFEILYYDVPMNKTYQAFFNAIVMYAVPTA